MAISVKCSVSGAIASFPSRWDAAQAGWRFATIEVPGRVKHFVFAPTETVRWLDEAMGDKPKKGKAE